MVGVCVRYGGGTCHHGEVQGMVRVCDRHGGSVCGHSGGAWEGGGTC